MPDNAFSGRSDEFAEDSLVRAKQIDRVCDAFEAAWSSGQRPSLEAAISESGFDQSNELLLQLVPIEIFYRVRRGELPATADYSGRFPHCDTSWLAAVIDEQLASIAAWGAGVSESTAAAGRSAVALSTHDAVSNSSMPELSGWEILGVLGRGGMGVVYRARDLELGRLVAIKMISAGDLAAAADIARFRREAATIAQLNDPHIVQLFEVGLAHRKPYLVMEYVPGPSLSEMLRQSLPPPRVAAELVALLARSIHEAHRRGIVHRDLKPANILIADEITHGVSDALDWLRPLKPKITDFGLAKTTTESCGLTMSGGILGTPSYMAPEQVRGESLIGPTTDVYGLGAILYELLTGRPPFKSFQVTTTLKQVLDQEPVAPQQLQPQIPADLNTICLKCLEKSSQGRYASAIALADDLDRFLRREPIRARATSRFGRAIRWCQRHPARATAAVLGLVAISSLGLVGIVYPFALSQARSAAAMRAEQQKTAQALEQVSVLRQEAEGLSASLAINQGQVLCESNNPARGLLWFARGLELLPDEHSALAMATRKNIAAWRTQVHILKQVRQLPRESMAMAMNRAGNELAIVGYDRKLHVFNTQRGEAVETPLQLQQVGTAIVYSDDGKWLACGTLNGTIMLCRMPGLNQVRSWKAHGEQIYDLAFADADQQLISAGRDSAVRFWRPDDGRSINSPLVHSGPVMCLALSPDGRQLLTGSMDGFLRRWNLSTGEPAMAPIAHPSGVLALTFSHDGRSYVLGRLDGTAQIFDSASHLPRGKAMEHRSRIRSVEFSADDRWVLTSSRDATARLWDVDSGLPVGAPLEHRDELCSALITPDNQTILTTAEDRTLRLWQVAQTNEGDIRPQVTSPSGTARSTPQWTSRQFFGMRWRHQDTQLVGFSPSGRLAYGVAAGALELSKAQAIQLYDATSGETIGQPLTLAGVLVDIAFSPDELQVATVSRAGAAQLWKIESDRVEPTHVLAARGMRSAAFHPSDGMLVTASRGGVQFWNGSDGSKATPTVTVRNPACVVFDDSGNRLAIIHDEGDVDVCDVPTGKVTASFPHDGASGVSSASFSSDSDSLLVSHWEGVVRVWHLSDPMKSSVSLEHREPVWAAQFSPDGRIVAAATSAGNIYLWDANTGTAVNTPFQQREYIDDLAFSPDGRTLVLGTSENKVRLLDVLTGRALGPIKRTSASVQHVHFVGAGNYFVSGDQTPAVRIFESPLPQAGTVENITADLEALCGLRLGADGVIRCLSVEEWRADDRLSDD